MFRVVSERPYVYISSKRRGEQKPKGSQCQRWMDSSGKRKTRTTRLLSNSAATNTREAGEMCASTDDRDNRKRLCQMMNGNGTFADSNAEGDVLGKQRRESRGGGKELFFSFFCFMFFKFRLTLRRLLRLSSSSTMPRPEIRPPWKESGRCETQLEHLQWV